MIQFAIPVVLGLGAMGLIKTAGDTAEQVGDAVEQSGNAALKFAVFTVVAAGSYFLVKGMK
ncbi:hypothetical protein K2C01_003860 [Vibrio vulnificus]|nr:hypothetical protein [Vibrio vulnificus]HDY8229141.1 hypothetical protein [Vibrio vulnificus]